MNQPIRAILFDVGNVLLRFDFSICLKALAKSPERRFQTARDLAADPEIRRLFLGGAH